jgi:hypothetical protein
MENASQITDTIRLPVTLDVHPYLRDHRFQGSAVLPAVESMQVLAAAASEFRPAIDPCRITNAQFVKFLFIAPQDTSINAFAEIAATGDGGVAARLITRHLSPQSGFTRIKEHAVVHFHDRDHSPAEPFDAGDFVKPDEDRLAISPETIYRELVPFGPAYHNLAGDVILYKKGADAILRAPDYPILSALGSPFILDAAFHAACVWGQRYTDMVGFPVGFETRTVLRPTQPGQTYHCRIAPVEVSFEMIKFDVLIYNKNELFEAVRGLMMKDVSGGKRKPPSWLHEGR